MMVIESEPSGLQLGIDDSKIVFFVSYQVGTNLSYSRSNREMDRPSIELAFTSCAQSVSKASGITSQDIESGIRR